MSQKEELYQKGSLMHYAVIGFSNIKKLSGSSLISEKLQGLSTLIFVIIMAIAISFWLPVEYESLFSIEYLISLFLAFVFSLIISIGYSPLLSLFANNKVSSLRLGLIILFLDLPVASIGLVLSNNLIIKIAVSILALQLFIVLFGSIVPYSKVTIPNVKVEANQIWDVIGKVGAICSILGFLATILIFLFGS